MVWMGYEMLALFVVESIHQHCIRAMIKRELKRNAHRPVDHPFLVNCKVVIALDPLDGNDAHIHRLDFECTYETKVNMLFT